jgi:hypothetical protein
MYSHDFKERIKISSGFCHGNGFIVLTLADDHENQKMVAGGEKNKMFCNVVPVLHLLT